MPRIVATREGTPLGVIDLRPGRTVLGNDLSVDFLLPDELVSHRHCILRYDGRRMWVTDCSTNGTYLRGERLPPGEEVLWDGLEPLSVGGFLLRPASAVPARPYVPTQKGAPPDVLISGTTASSTARVAVIVFERGPLRGTEVPLTSSELTLGGAGCTVNLGPPHRGVVAEIEVVRAACLLAPVQRRVPVFVDGTPLDRVTLLSPGVRVTIGNHTFGVRTEDLVTANPPAEPVGELVGEHPLMRQLYGAIRRVARHDTVTVLVVGPTGTGKELVARAVHELSPRADGPFVAVNCREVNADLLPSHVFGHEKAAFTGAAGRTDGLWRTAHRGTLVLDEFGEYPPEVQVQLLRAIETGEIRRIGGTTVERPDVRVICCTNRNLLDDAEAERFREDLLHRIAAAVLVTPPLAARLSDLPILAEALLARIDPAARITDAAKAHLQVYDWPGNVRELRQVLTRALIDAEGRPIDVPHLRFTRDLFGAAPPAPPPFDQDVATLVPKPMSQMTEEELRRERAVRSPAQMAAVRNVSRGQVLYWLRRRGVSSPPDVGGCPSRRIRSKPPG